jgi:methylmalonyl-CoA decarboxylase subunit alpha
MSWEPEVRAIAERRSRALALGGEERVERQHDQGKLTIRERIDAFLDPGTFREVGQLAAQVDYHPDGSIASYTPAGYVGGTGRVEGRQVVVGGSDFTVRGGSSEGGHGVRTKQEFIEEAAGKYRCPLVLFIDGAGADVRGMETSGHMYLPYRDWSLQGRLLGVSPVVAAVVGPAAGGPAGIALLSHWIGMVRGSSFIFASGPPVVKRALGHEVTKEELGGADVHTRVSGVADNAYDSEAELFAAVRRFLSYLPSNVWERPPSIACADPPDRAEEELLSIVPRDRKKPYSMRRVLELVVDQGSLFEIKPDFGRCIITAFARLEGHVVGVVANNPLVGGGALDADGADKEAHFIELCDVFHIPLVYFADIPGFMIGNAAERKGTLRKGMRAVLAGHMATVPQLTVLVRRAYGMGANAMGTPYRVNLRMAWPSGEWSSIPIEGGVDAAFRREIAAAPDPAERRREIEGRLLAFRNPFLTAESFALEELIDPRQTRPILCDLLRLHRDTPGPPVGPSYLVRP